VKILDVRLEVVGETVDALGKERDLHLGRAGIVSGALVCLYDLRFLRDLQSHSQALLRVVSSEPAILSKETALNKVFEVIQPLAPP
jgi:hypothetical protein